MIIPTNTWQAYNFYDADGDGWGDTWYAGGTPARRAATRPTASAVFRPASGATTSASSAGSTGTSSTPDFLADDDLEAFATVTTCASSTT